MRRLRRGYWPCSRRKYFCLYHCNALGDNGNKSNVKNKNKEEKNKEQLSYFHMVFYLAIDGSVGRNPPASARDAGPLGLTPALGRSPGVGNGNPLQCSCLGELMDRGAWRATVHRVAKCWAGQSYWAQAIGSIYHLSGQNGHVFNTWFYCPEILTDK